MKKVIKTPYKDINGEVIKVEDVIIFGMLDQHWRVSQATKDDADVREGYAEVGDFLITVISDDSGEGYVETMKDCGIEIRENGTEICKEGCYSS